MDLSIFGYPFMQNAILAAFLGGVACATVGVFVVLMGISFIGVCLSHAAFAGALLGVLLGFDPLLGAFLFSLGTAAIIGPLASRGELNLDTSIGVLFSLMLEQIFVHRRRPQRAEDRSFQTIQHCRKLIRLFFR